MHAVTGNSSGSRAARGGPLCLVTLTAWETAVTVPPDTRRSFPPPTPPHPTSPSAFPEERQPPVRARDPTASAPTTKRGSTSHEPKRVECCTIFFFYQMGGCSRGCKVTLRRRRRASAVCCTLAALSRPQGIPRCPRKSWLCSSTPRGANLKTERSAALPPAVVIHCYVRRASYDTGRSQGSVRARLKRSA